MRLRILAVGKLKEGYLREAAADYAARIRPYARIEVLEVPGRPDPVRPTRAAIERVREEEAASLLQRLQPGEAFIALDPGGRAMTSEDFAELLRPYEAAGAKVALFIGGCWGLGRSLLDLASAVVSLSSMTFPRGLARVILLEQIYRAIKIIRGEAYHK